jgi:hypothetical protein
LCRRLGVLFRMMTFSGPKPANPHVPEHAEQKSTSIGTEPRE